MKTLNFNKITWIDIYKPQKKDIEFLEKNFSFHPYVIRDITKPIRRPKVEFYKDHFWLVLHFPVFNPQTRQTFPSELDFIVTRETIITIHENIIPSLKNFVEKRAQADDSTNLNDLDSAGKLLLILLDYLVDACFPMVDHIDEHIETIEKQVFQNIEREMLNEIAIVKRDIIDFRRIIKPNHQIFEILHKKIPAFFSEDLYSLTQEVIGSNNRVWNVLENNKEMIEAIGITNESLLSHKITEIMKVLTIISFITLPLSLITSFLGMDIFQNVPFIKHPSAYLIIGAIFIFIIIFLLIYFKKKKWL